MPALPAGERVLGTHGDEKGKNMKILMEYRGTFWGIRLEQKVQDFWIGVFWKNRKYDKRRFNQWRGY